MRVQVFQHEVIHLQSGLITVLILTSHELSTSCLPKWLLSLGLQIVVVSPVGTGFLARPVIVNNDVVEPGKIIDVGSIAPDILLVAAIGGFSEVDAAAMASSFGAPPTEICISHFASINDSELLVDIFRCIIRRLQNVTQRNALLNSAMSTARQDIEKSVRIPSEIAEFLRNLQVDKVKQGFSNEYSPLLSRRFADSRAKVEVWEQAVCQSLPIGMSGFIGVDFHVADVQSSEGAILVEMWTGGATELECVWRVPLQMVRKGWLCLRRNSASSLIGNAPEFRLSSIGLAQGAVVLSLRSTGMFEEFAACLGNVKIANSMLLVRTWFGLPGIPHPPLPRSVRQRSEVSPQAIRTAAPSGSLSSSGLEALANGSIRMLPGVGAVRCAGFNVELPGGSCAIGCYVRLNNPVSKVRVRTRLGVLDVNENWEDVEEKRWNGASEWMVVGAAENVELIAPIRDAPDEVSIRIFLLFALDSSERTGSLTIFSEFFIETVGGDVFFPVSPL